MEPVSELRQREVKTYFDVIAQGGSERLLSARSFHNLGEWDHADYEALIEILDSAEAKSSFSFLGREAEQCAQTIEMLAENGHEIVLHGYRHIGCADIPYETAYENISRGLVAIEDAADVRPQGFIAPRQTVNEATLHVLEELDFSWILGNTEADIPASLTFREPAYPYDLLLLNRGATPSETFDQLTEQSEEGVAHLLHPNMLEYYSGLSEFTTWLQTHNPVTIASMIDEGGIGIICDAMRPLKIE